MTHPENVTRVAQYVTQIEHAWIESFRMARRLLQAQEPESHGWDDSVAKERYMAWVPMIAERICSQLANASSFLRGASDSQTQQIYESLEQMIQETKKINDTKTGAS